MSTNDVESQETSNESKICRIEDSDDNNIARVKHFICLDQDFSEISKTCKPHLEFSNVVEFMAKIPYSKDLLRSLRNRDLKTLLKMASKSKEIKDYDAYNAFFYNADSYLGALENVFDTNYIAFFLKTFYYFIDHIFVEKTAVILNGSLVHKISGRPIDLLCIPDCFSNLVFGSEIDSTNIFNLILADTAITDFLVTFINLLLSQINSSKSVENNRLKDHNTLGLYIDVLKTYLTKTKLIAERNFNVKYEFLNNSTNFMFAYIPFSNGNPSNDPNDVGIINLSPPLYTNNYILAKFLK